MNRMLLTMMTYRGNDYRLYGLFDENKKCIDFQLFPIAESIINNIYCARVSKIVPSINAAFVSIAPNVTCYLSLKDAKEVIYTNKHSKKEELCEGDEILVQVVKDALKTKEPVVSTKLSLFGENVILTSQDTSIGVSNKIPKMRSSYIKQLILDNFKDHKEIGYGVIIRTNASNVSDEKLILDLASLQNTYIEILNKASHANLYTCVYFGKPDYLLRTKTADFRNIDSIVTDDDEIFNTLCDEYKHLDDASKITRYRDDSVSLATLYGLRTLLDKLSSRQVWLKSGANIIIEQLETLTFIDVNSAKNQSKNKDYMFQINKEAAVEIASQLKLRNISGMIIIDFINLKSQEEISKLIDVLKIELLKDNITCTFVDITKLGLVELTRKKTHKSLAQILKKTLDE